MTRRRRLAPLALLMSLALVSCNDSPTVISGAEVSAYVAAVLIEDVDVRAILHSGAPPVAAGGPSVSAPASLNGITGGSALLQLAGGGQFRQVVVFVPGIDGYYLAELPFDLTAVNAIITVGGRVPVSSFEVAFAVADANGVWGAPDGTSVSVIAAAGGDIQVSVTWNTVADVDLHVVEPSGREIYYGSRNSPSGGTLDIDANAACSTDALWQENVGWASQTAPSGQYTVRVDYWSSCDVAQTDYVVTVYLKSDTPAVPGSPGSGVSIFTGSFTGEGTRGGAGAGVFITNFVF
ncbi:MAG TPA: hypothetical protein VMM35_08525 [Longimicrobiales bacterium]|nr:hypothetical protein [Longimicrobiales bacterium]